MVRDDAGHLRTVHVVRTPELVEFEFELAGLGSRFLAWLLDAALITTLATAACFAVTLLVVFAGWAAILGYFLVMFAAHWGWFTLFEWRHGGRTPGKRALGLRVIHRTGVPIGFSEAALRNLVRVVDALPSLYVVGGAAVLLSTSRRRLGDLVAGTIVIRERKRAIPAGLRSAELGKARHGAIATLQERLRRAPLVERELLLSAALRREELDDASRATLFAELRAALVARHEVEKPDHLSDERFVVEAVAAVLEAEGALQPRGK